MHADVSLAALPASSFLLHRHPSQAGEKYMQSSGISRILSS